jgi:predicted Zn-dependent protease with MMP-like domain
VPGNRHLRVLPNRPEQGGRAAPAAPDRAAEPPVTRQRFERLVREAIDSIPKRFQRAMDNIVIVVEDEPSDDLLDEMGIDPPDTLFGLYQGTPLTERTSSYGNVLPDRIVLFQGPIEDDSETEDDVVVAIGETLIHEVGHYFGLSEDEIEEIEEKYWRGES